MAESGKQNPWFKLTVYLITLAVVAIIVLVALVRERLVNPNQWTVTIMGRGRVTFAPELATVTLGVETFKAASAQTALEQNSEKLAKVLAKVKELGVSEPDIKTTSYNLSPFYEMVADRSQVTGYNATQQLTVKIRDLSKAGEIIAAAVKQGANLASDVNFTVEDLEKVKEQARVLALADAKAKVGKLAKTAGVRLGKVVGFWENYLSSPESDLAAAYGKGGEGGGGGGASVVSPGQLEVVIEMSLIYKVK